MVLCLSFYIVFSFFYHVWNIDVLFSVRKWKYSSTICSGICLKDWRQHCTIAFYQIFSFTHSCKEKKYLKGTKHLSFVVDAASSNLYSEFYTEYVKVIVFPTVFLLISNIRNGQECAVELLSLHIFMRFSIPVVVSFDHGKNLWAEVASNIWNQTYLCSSSMA